MCGPCLACTELVVKGQYVGPVILVQKLHVCEEQQLPPPGEYMSPTPISSQTSPFSASSFGGLGAPPAPRLAGPGSLWYGATHTHSKTLRNLPGQEKLSSWRTEGPLSESQLCPSNHWHVHIQDTWSVGLMVLVCKMEASVFTSSRGLASK